MEAVTFENMSGVLIRLFPELSVDYQNLVDWWDGDTPGSHVVFGDILNPYILSLLETKHDQEKLRAIFDFLERLAKHEDKRVQEVIMMTVCERLAGSKEQLHKARSYMGPVTRRFSEEIETFWKGGK